MTLLELLATAAGAGVVATWQVLAPDGLHGLTLASVSRCCLLLSGIGQFSTRLLQTGTVATGLFLLLW